VVAFVCAWACAAATAEPPRDKPIWLAVTRPMFERALAPLAGHRGAEGLEAVVTTEPVERAIAKLPRPPACILLVGDDSDDPADAGRPWRVPVRRLPFYRWRDVQPPTFASDAAWGDLDADGLPDVPVGRLPVRTARELERIVAKIIAYESRPLRADDLRLSVWAGSAMYGEVVDRLANTLLLTTLKNKSPAWLEPWVLLTEASEPPDGAKGDPARAFLDQVRRGGLMTLLIGHASRTSFAASQTTGRWVELTARRAERELEQGEVASPMVIVACDTGDFVDPKARRRSWPGSAPARDATPPAAAPPTPSLGEALLLAPAGPVAVVAATTESHPLPNAYLGRAMLDQMAHPYRRLGTWFLAAQREAAAMRDPLLEATLRDVEGKLEERIDTARLQQDQQLTYAILGDPATRIRLPREMELAVEREQAAWRWRVVSPPSGARVLEVGVRRPAAMPGAFEPVRPPAPDQPWQGTVTGPGVLRVLAADRQNLWVAAANLEPERKAP